MGLLSPIILVAAITTVLVEISLNFLTKLLSWLEFLLFIIILRIKLLVPVWSLRCLTQMMSWNSARSTLSWIRNIRIIMLLNVRITIISWRKVALNIMRLSLTLVYKTICTTRINIWVRILAFIEEVASTHNEWVTLGCLRLNVKLLHFSSVKTRIIVAIRRIELILRRKCLWWLKWWAIWIDLIVLASLFSSRRHLRLRLWIIVKDLT